MTSEKTNTYGSPYERRPILDAEAVADLLYLASGREALKMARERRLPCVRVGRRILFIRDEVIRYLAEQSRDAITDDDLRRGKV